MSEPDRPVRSVRVEASERPLHGVVQVAGSKSLSQRALLLAAIAEGESRLGGVLDAEDSRVLIAALRALGVVVGEEPARGDRGGSIDLRVEGSGGRLRGGATLDLGENATGARTLMALATLADAPVRIDGGARLRQRPMGDGVALLRSAGATVVELGPPGRLPVEVAPGAEGGAIEVGRTASSQFISALLLAAPAWPQGVSLSFTHPPTSASYLELSIHALEAWGVAVEAQRGDRGLLRVAVEPGAIRGRSVAIEPDASTALVFAGLAAAVPGSDLLLAGLSPSSPQPDAAALMALRAMGVAIDAEAAGVRVRAPQRLAAIDWPCGSIPDAVPWLATLAGFAAGRSVLRELDTLRGKESDRIAAIEDLLRGLGIACRSASDAGGERLEIDGAPDAGRATRVDSRTDHRIAMAAAIAGVRCGGVEIVDPGCVAKSDPGFWRRVRALAPGRVCD
jgi:3-phosphoshikimate 1-carboxyvinyltransferase